MGYNEGLASLVLHTHIQLLHVGELLEGPSLPRNLHNTTSDGMPSITITWDPPANTGGYRIDISKYIVRIPDLTYSAEEESTTYSHTITTNGSYIMFNVPYMVQVIAMNTCEDIGDPANVTINIEASGKYMYWVMHEHS